MEMVKIRKVADQRFTFICPACNSDHIFDDRWEFNGDFEKPTLSPSYKQEGCLNGAEEKYGICHSHIKDGMISYCPDCTHEMAGKTTDLLEYDN